MSVLFGTMYFVQGIGEPTEGLLAQPVKSLLKGWHHRPLDIILFGSLLVFPWFLKPLYGLMSDFVPIGGYRRRSYLALTSGVSAAALLGLFFFPMPPGSWYSLLFALLVPTAAVAWSSVVVDALMVEWGQPRGLTGRLQSVQWGSMWAATIVAGAWGGYLSDRRLEQWSFLVCGMLSLVVLALALSVVREPVAQLESASFHEALDALGHAVRRPSVLLVGAFLFVWSFSPFSTTILYIHMTGDLGLSERDYGDSISVLALGCLIASAGYGLYCRRIRFGALLRMSIVCGSLSTLAYWALVDRASAFALSFAVGFFHMTGLMVTLDLAARSCPLRAAGTIFASLMALTNISAALAGWIGGEIYERALETLGGQPAFSLLVVIGSVLPAACWLLVPVLSRHLAEKQHWNEPAEDGQLAP